MPNKYERFLLATVIIKAIFFFVQNNIRRRQEVVQASFCGTANTLPKSQRDILN